MTWKWSEKDASSKIVMGSPAKQGWKRKTALREKPCWGQTVQHVLMRLCTAGCLYWTLHNAVKSIEQHFLWMLENV